MIIINMNNKKTTFILNKRRNLEVKSIEHNTYFTNIYSL